MEAQIVIIAILSVIILALFIILFVVIVDIKETLQSVYDGYYDNKDRIYNIARIVENLPQHRINEANKCIKEAEHIMKSIGDQ